ncbi:Hypothetical protein POVN_LOCUS548 [uncultured virus]|nr:Hypothetical protein POVN_LOCUS548 [uncultured virus]
MKAVLFCFALFAVAVLSQVSPRYPPPTLVGGYTLDGKIALEYHYFNDAAGGHFPSVYTAGMIDAFIGKIRVGGVHHYPWTDPLVSDAMNKYVHGRDVLVVGSVSPWYEAMAISYGAKSCTVVEYRKIASQDSRLESIHIDDFAKAVEAGRKWDVIVSISSIEHDGLGRYGDPLNPQADLQHMEKAKTWLREGGIALVAVPVGIDKVVFNAHRIYGAIRLPLLFKGWNVVDSFGVSTSFDDALLKLNAGWVHQPVYVLQPQA